MEHPDDDRAVVNERVKGSLKITRAFGAGFLKKVTSNSLQLPIFAFLFSWAKVIFTILAAKMEQCRPGDVQNRVCGNLPLPLMFSITPPP